MSYVFSSTFGYLRNLTELTLFHYKQRTLLADDALMNVLGTLCVLMMRNAYRKGHQFSQAASKRSVNSEQAACIMYRCRLALRAGLPVAASTLSAVSVPPPSASIAPTTQPVRPTIQLEFARVNKPFSVTDVCLPCVVDSLPASISWQLHLVSAVSLVFVFVALLSLNASLVVAASAISACGAAVVFVVYVSFAQRELLTRQLSSFNFLFLSVQLCIIHVCFADLVGWSSPRLLVILSSWLWTHWVLIIDTVLPVHKTVRLHYRPRVAVLVLLLFVVQQIAVLIAIVIYSDSTDPRLAFRDREVFVIALHGRVRQVRVVPILLGRMVTALSWCVRLLWRLNRSMAETDGELLLMQGRVEFDNPIGRPREPLVPVAPGQK